MLIAEKLVEENFFIRNNDHPNKVYSVSLLKMQQKTKMDEFIHFYRDKINATTSDVVATYFCKYYGWALAGLQYLLSIDTTLHLSLSNTELQIYYNKKNDHYDITFKLNEYSTQPCIHPKERLEEVYEHNVTPLLQAFVDNTNVTLRDLWGQLYFAIHNGHKKNLELAQSQAQKKKLDDHFTLLTKELKPEVFKANKKNPLDITFRMLESPRETNVYYPMKPTCCLYYQIEGVKNKCYTCPRLMKEEREQRKEEIRASL